MEILDFKFRNFFLFMLQGLKGKHCLQNILIFSKENIKSFIPLLWLKKI